MKHLAVLVLLLSSNAWATHPSHDCEALLMATKRYDADSRGMHTAKAISAFRNFRRNTMEVVTIKPNLTAPRGKTDRSSNRDKKFVAARIRGIEKHFEELEKDGKKLVVAGAHLVGWADIQEFERDLNYALEEVQTPPIENGHPINRLSRSGLATMSSIGTLNLLLAGLLFSPDGYLSATHYMALIAILQDPIALAKYHLSERQRVDWTGEINKLKSGWRYDSINHELHRNTVQQIWNRENSHWELSNQDAMDSHGTAYGLINQAVVFHNHGPAGLARYNNEQEKAWIGIDRLFFINPDTQEPEMLIMVRSTVGPPKAFEKEKESAGLTELNPAYQSIPVRK